MDKARRKELLQQYADRGPQTGVFAVRNNVTNEVWVGESKNIDKQQNGLWMRLRAGRCYEDTVQASWEKHGEAAFTYEILETVIEADPHRLQRVMPERAAAWRAQLGAGIIKGT
jgi:hypothetical protein